jgi:TRAP-type C4-dicarboxylate transport system permease large subunit
MKKYSLLSLLVVIAVAFSSCQAIGDIFKAGMWSGIIIVVIVVVLIIWLFSRSRR